MDYPAWDDHYIKTDTHEKNSLRYITEYTARKRMLYLIRDTFFSKLETKIPDFKSLSHDTLISLLMNSSNYLINCQ